MAGFQCAASAGMRTAFRGTAGRACKYQVFEQPDPLWDEFFPAEKAWIDHIFTRMAVDTEAGKAFSKITPSELDLSSEAFAAPAAVQGPEWSRQANLVEDLARLPDRPFLPIRIGMLAVPNARKLSHLPDWHDRSPRDGVPFGPGIDILGASERQDCRAIMMNIVPCGLEGHGKMRDEIILGNGAIDDVNVDVLGLAADP
jgi:hypothetical protein